MNELENQEPLKTGEVITDDSVVPGGTPAAEGSSGGTGTDEPTEPAEDSATATGKSRDGVVVAEALESVDEASTAVGLAPDGSDEDFALAESSVQEGTATEADLEQVSVDQADPDGGNSMQRATVQPFEEGGVKAAAEDETVAVTNGADAEDASEPVGVPGMDWYIIHTYSGFENKVKDSLRTRADAFGFADCIGEILIPTEDVVEMRAGKKITSRRLLYPGYIVLQLKMDDELWHVVKNTPRVTGFVGSDPSPTPLTADEVNRILYRQASSQEKPRPKMSFQHNDRVRIIDGPFTNFAGTVEEISDDRSTLKVMVTIFGRGTPVELEYFQVEREKL